jgi:hypothetical protein
MHDRVSVIIIPQNLPIVCQCRVEEEHLALVAAHK